jgi:replicative DNA helicase
MSVCGHCGRESDEWVKWCDGAKTHLCWNCFGDWEEQFEANEPPEDPIDDSGWVRFHESQNGAGPRVGPDLGGLVDGATFILDVPDSIPAIWGEGTQVLWPEGEPLLIYGPDGVGKSSIAQQLVLARIGVGPGTLLGLPVAPSAGKVLYLALDRPKQARRSFHRMATEDERDVLRERLTVWPRSFPLDLVGDPEGLCRFAVSSGADTIVIDSLKDVVDKLSDEDAGMAIHKSWQLCVEHGIEVCALHHPRKAQGDNKRPTKLADVYGSRWLTAGCGSVILIWAEAGDPIVEFEHLKQPADVVGPLMLLHDNRQGTTSVVGDSDVVRIITAGGGSMDVAEVAAVMFKKGTARNNAEKARRRLEAEVSEGRLRRREVPGERGEKVVYEAL